MTTKTFLATVVFVAIVAAVNIAVWWYVTIGFYSTMIQGG
jgi:hypothetical protein